MRFLGLYREVTTVIIIIIILPEVKWWIIEKYSYYNIIIMCDLQNFRAPKCYCSISSVWVRAAIVIIIIPA